MSKIFFFLTSHFYFLFSFIYYFRFAHFSLFLISCFFFFFWLILCYLTIAYKSIYTNNIFYLLFFFLNQANEFSFLPSKHITEKTKSLISFQFLIYFLFFVLSLFHTSNQIDHKDHCFGFVVLQPLTQTFGTESWMK